MVESLIEYLRHEVNSANNTHAQGIVLEGSTPNMMKAASFVTLGTGRWTIVHVPRDKIGSPSFMRRQLPFKSKGLGMTENVTVHRPPTLSGVATSVSNRRMNPW